MLHVMSSILLFIAWLNQKPYKSMRMPRTSTVDYILGALVFEKYLEPGGRIGKGGALLFVVTSSLLAEMND